MEEESKYISGSVIQPQKYNIVLTREGAEITFDFPPATADQITRFGYILPEDQRCNGGLIFEEEELYEALGPVLGQNYRGNLAYHTRKQVIVTLHETAILGYQRQLIIDPRLGSEVALFWEIYLDQRVFHQALDESWQLLMAEIISMEREDESADRKLAEDIKEILLNDVASEEEA